MHLHNILVIEHSLLACQDPSGSQVISGGWDTRSMLKHLIWRYKGSFWFSLRPVIVIFLAKGRGSAEILPASYLGWEGGR